MASRTSAPSLFDPAITRRAVVDAFKKLNPRTLAKNPVIFVTEVVSLGVTLLFVRDLVAGNGQGLFSGQIAAWLWFTVLFANFAEAVAEGPGQGAGRRHAQDPQRHARQAPRRTQATAVPSRR